MTEPLTTQQPGRLTAAARRALDALNDLIRDSSDPGTEALGARYELEQALLTGQQPPVTDPGTKPERLMHFTDADGDELHIGIPVDPANGSAAISFYTPTEPVHIPVEQIGKVIHLLRRLVAQQSTV